MDVYNENFGEFNLLMLRVLTNFLHNCCAMIIYFISALSV